MFSSWILIVALELGWFRYRVHASKTLCRDVVWKLHRRLALGQLEVFGDILVSSVSSDYCPFRDWRFLSSPFLYPFASTAVPPLHKPRQMCFLLFVPLPCQGQLMGLRSVQSLRVSYLEGSGLSLMFCHQFVILSSF